jgi:hypothetical protein
MPLNLEPYATQCAPPCAGGFRPGPAQQALAQQTAQQPSWQNLAAGSAALFFVLLLPFAKAFAFALSVKAYSRMASHGASCMSSWRMAHHGDMERGLGGFELRKPRQGTAPGSGFAD